MVTACLTAVRKISGGGFTRENSLCLWLLVNFAFWATSLFNLVASSSIVVLCIIVRFCGALHRCYC